MSRAWRPGGTAGAGIQALGECEWLPRHGQTAPEASHESRARAKIGARAGKRAADGEEGDFARSREQREAVARRSARLERAPADKEDRTRELGTEGQQQRVDGCRTKEQHAPRRQPLRGSSSPATTTPPTTPSPSPSRTAGFQVEHGRTCEAKRRSWMTSCSDARIHKPSRGIRCNAACGWATNQNTTTYLAYGVIALVAGAASRLTRYSTTSAWQKMHRQGGLL